MMVFLVLGACILGAILLLIFVLRALYNKALGVEKNPTAEKPSEEEERLLSPSSKYERPSTVSVPVEESTIREPSYEEEPKQTRPSEYEQATDEGLEVPITKEEGWGRRKAQVCQEVPITKEESWEVGKDQMCQEECEEPSSSALKNEYYAVDEFVLGDDSD